MKAFGDERLFETERRDKNRLSKEGRPVKPKRGKKVSIVTPLAVVKAPEKIMLK